MRVAALYFGVVGGMTGLLWGAGILTICPGSCPLGIAGNMGLDTLIWGACAAYFLSIAGVTAWILAFTRPRVGGWMMVVAGLGSLVAAFPLFVVPGVFMFIGGVLRLGAGKPQLEPEQVT